MLSLGSGACKTTWRDGRADDGGGLENRCGATHRGFESLSLRLSFTRGGAGVAERGRLLSACRGYSLYRGFESLPPRLRPAKTAEGPKAQLSGLFTGKRETPLSLGVYLANVTVNRRSSIVYH